MMIFLLSSRDFDGKMTVMMMMMIACLVYLFDYKRKEKKWQEEIKQQT